MQKLVDCYGVALMMISEGCADPAGFAARVLKKAKDERHTAGTAISAALDNMRPRTAAFCAVDRANGMGERDPRGSYVLMSVEADGCDKPQLWLLSETGADLLVKELQGCLRKR